MRLTIPELNLLSKNMSEQAEREDENRIYYHHLQSHLNAFSFHDPKHIPKYISLLPKKSSTRKKIDMDEKAEIQNQADGIGLRIPG